jgi:HSP20 family molecular chaperone IbpA
MTLRPPRRPFSVSRQLSERARAAAPPEQPSVTGGFNIAGLDGVTNIAGFDGVAGMVGALRGLVEQLAAAAQQHAAPPDQATPDPASSSAGENAHTVSFGGGKGRMVFGYTLRMGADGVSAEPFGNVPEPPPKARAGKPAPIPPATVTPAALQPIVEVYQDGNTVVVIAELPGADPERVLCQADGIRLLIEAAGARQYRKDLVLPVPVRSDGIVQTIQNGILEVRLMQVAAP